ncbi:MAG: MATE family efflux transporter [Holosporales bacterium]|jgi:MATE family multidrug resistance protein|nr:MATE family efflux transporter [Holosporales bacterium]
MKPEFIKSLRAFDVFKISWPMIVSSFSSHLMMILDQLILANYSLDAMTAAASASVWCMTLQCSTASITMISGSIVGNYNGAGKYDLCGIPVWQMLWFSSFLFAISIPIAFFCGNICIPENLQKDGLPYFRLVMLFAPLSGFSYTLSSFFVSIGKGALVTMSIMITNIVNVLLDIVLVFGLFGITGFVGSSGAAVGTVVSQAVNVTILTICFFKKKIRTRYGTTNFKLRLAKMRGYLKLGTLAGFAHIVELSAWGVLYHLLANTDKKMAAIHAIAFSVNLFLAFVVSGLERGMLAISSNLLGSGLRDKIPQALKSGISIHLMFMAVIASVFFFAPEFILRSFIKFDILEELISDGTLILRLVFLYMLFDGICWIIAGVMEGGGDISFTMLTIATCICSIVAIPALILYFIGNLNVYIVWLLLDVTIVVITYALYRRYKSNRWIRLSGSDSGN